MNQAAAAWKFQFIGGELCLDFCNTVGGKRGVVAREHLHSYADFISWCEQAELMGAERAGVLRGRMVRRATEAEAVYNRAVALREAIYGIFAAMVEDKVPSANDLARLNAELANALGRMRIEPARGGFAWAWAHEPAALDQALGPIARSAALLLTSEHERGQVRRCKGDGCGWLFVDASKNHSRRWCDMADCGNRAKVRRHRLKQRRGRKG